MLTNPNSEHLHKAYKSYYKIKLLIKVGILSDLPILLHDPVSLLLIMLINLSAHVDISIYQALVSFIFNLVYTQNLLVLIRKLDKEQIKELNVPLYYYYFISQKLLNNFFYRYIKTVNLKTMLNSFIQNWKNLDCFNYSNNILLKM